jgi:hypothetical protein
VEYRAGPGDEGVDEFGPVLCALEASSADRGELVDASGGQVAQPTLDV